MTARTLTVYSNNTVALDGMAIGRIQTETGKPALFMVNHPAYSTEFIGHTESKIPVVTKDGRRAYAPRVAEMLGLLDQYRTEDTNILRGAD